MRQMTTLRMARGLQFDIGIFVRRMITACLMMAMVLGFLPTTASAHSAPPSDIFQSVSSWNGVTFHEPNLQWARGPRWENAHWDGSHTKCNDRYQSAHLDKRVGFIDSQGNTIWEPFIHSEAGYWNCEDTANYHEGWTMDGYPTAIDAVGIHWQVYIGGNLIAYAKTYWAPAPQNLRIVSSTQSSVSLAWDDTLNEDSYELQRSDDDGATWAMIHAPVANATSYQDLSVEKGNTYRYRIRSVFPTKPSEWSNEVIATTACSGDSDCDGLTNSDEQDVLGTSPTKRDTDGDGLLDPWEAPDEATHPVTGLPEPIENAGFTPTTVSTLTQTVSRDDVFGDYGVSDCPSADDQRRPSHPRSCLNAAPNPLHKDIYLELDWQDCSASDDCFPYDPLHHAPDMDGLESVVEMFASAAEVTNPDGAVGVNLRINVDEAIPHAPNCDRGASAARQEYFGTENQRLLGADYITAKELAVRYVWSGHSSQDDNHGDCETPGAFTAGLTGLGIRDLEDYDWTPFGDANTGGRDILVTLGIIWSCHSDIQNINEPIGDCDREYSDFSPASFGVFPATVRDDQGNVKNVQYPVARLLGVPEDAGTAQLWGRTLAHLLGHSLGIADDDYIRNDPDAPGEDEDGDGRTDQRPIDPYLTWSNLAYAPPQSDGMPSAFEDFPDFDYLQNSDSDLDGIAEGADNCPGDYNPEESGPFVGDVSQPDQDFDGRGDTCDPDADGDGMISAAFVGPGSTLDLLPFDTDNDGLNNTRDSDDDSDGIQDEADTCPVSANPSQRDRDGDGLGNGCDPDTDGDGYSDALEYFIRSRQLNAPDVPGTGNLLNYLQGLGMGHPHPIGSK